MAISAPAFAQSGPGPNDSMFDRGRNVSVSERAHPEYDPVPVPVGAFTVLPVLTAGVEFNDNIYSTNSNKRSDTVFNLAPEVSVSSRWSRNAVTAFARVGSRLYGKNSAENTTDVQGGGSGRLDIGRFGSLTGGGDIGVLHEPRSAPTSPTNISKPVEYTAGNLFINAQQEFDRVRLTGRYDYQNLDYKNATTTAGRSVLQDDRDHSVSTVGGKAEYAISPAIAVFGTAAYNDHHYRLTPPTVPQNRNSTGGEVTVGTSFDLTSLSRGSIQVGYQDQKYNGRFGHVKGLSAAGRIEWFPTELTTLSLNGARGIQDAAATGAPAFVSESFGLQADHELLRNVVLTGRIGYETDKYQVIDRSDKQTNALLAAKYRMNRLLGFTLSYNYATLSSSGRAAGARYTDNKFLLSAGLQF
jgi:hypothetical protein